jgi:hypothetical protein
MRQTPAEAVEAEDISGVVGAGREQGHDYEAQQRPYQISHRRAV